jgi:hypothetical protein
LWTVWGRGEVHTEFWWENLRHRDRLENLNTDGTIILKGYLRDGTVAMDWIDLAQNKVI